MDLLSDLEGGRNWGWTSVLPLKEEGVNKKKTVESQVLATHLKGAVTKKERCAIEIRAAIGSESHAAAQRLLQALLVAGFKAELIDVVATPHTGILVEASNKCAKTALSIQTAFGIVGIEAHLLIQSTPKDNTVIVHLGQEAKPNA
jgi:hypothetical protein